MDVCLHPSLHLGGWCLPATLPAHQTAGILSTPLFVDLTLFHSCGSGVTKCEYLEI